MKELTDVIEFITPKEMAKELEVAPETLRKYVNLFDKLSEKDFFKRDNQNARIYTGEDKTLLKRFMEIKELPSETVESAVQKLVDESSETVETPAVLAETTTQNDDSEVFQQLAVLQSNMLGEYKGLIDQVLEDNQELKQGMKELMESQKAQMEELTKRENEREKKYAEELDRMQKQAVKKGFFARMFGK